MATKTTKKKNYSRGPWHCHKFSKVGGGHGFQIQGNPRGMNIASVVPGVTSDRIEPIAEANAVLIATAPELLEALKGMFKAHETYSDEFCPDGKIRKVCDWGLLNDAHIAAAQAIEKATAKATA